MFTFRGTFGSERGDFMYFDAVVVKVKKNLLLFRLALAILCVNLQNGKTILHHLVTTWQQPIDQINKLLFVCKNTAE